MKFILRFCVFELREQHRTEAIVQLCIVGEVRQQGAIAGFGCGELLAALLHEGEFAQRIPVIGLQGQSLLQLRRGFGVFFSALNTRPSCRCALSSCGAAADQASQSLFGFGQALGAHAEVGERGQRIGRVWDEFSGLAKFRSAPRQVSGLLQCLAASRADPAALSGASATACDQDSSALFCGCCGDSCTCGQRGPGAGQSTPADVRQSVSGG